MKTHPTLDFWLISILWCGYTYLINAKQINIPVNLHKKCLSFQSLPRPTEESTKPDENNTLPTNKTIEETSQLINSVFLSNIIEGFGNIKLESISDAKSLFTIDDMIKHTQSMNKTLKDKDTKEREKRMEEISKKIRVFLNF